MLGIALMLTAGLGAMLWVSEHGGDDDSEHIDLTDDSSSTVPEDTGGFTDESDRDLSILDEIQPSTNDEGANSDNTITAVTPSDSNRPELNEFLADQVLIGSSESEVISGSEQADIVIGDRGSDLLDGGGGDDVLIGGDDYEMTEGYLPYSSSESDTLVGGEGDDILISHSGSMEGGDGNDCFIVSGLGTVEIEDYSVGDEIIILRNTSDFDLSGGQSADATIEVNYSEESDRTEIFVDGTCAAFLPGHVDLRVEDIETMTLEALGLAQLGMG